MARRKRNYNTGDIFAVPLRDGGYALGVVVHYSRGGVVLGYFFGPRYPNLPPLQEIAELDPKDVILIRLFGDLGLLNTEWPIIGSISDWEKHPWSIPSFVRPSGTDPNLYYLLTYDPKQLGEALNVESIPVAEARMYPEDGLSGYGAIEIRLTNLLPKNEDHDTTSTAEIPPT